MIIIIPFKLILVEYQKSAQTLFLIVGIAPKLNFDSITISTLYMTSFNRLFSNR